MLFFLDAENTEEMKRKKTPIQILYMYCIGYWEIDYLNMQNFHTFDWSVKCQANFLFLCLLLLELFAVIFGSCLSFLGFSLFIRRLQEKSKLLPNVKYVLIIHSSVVVYNSLFKTR